MTITASLAGLALGATGAMLGRERGARQRAERLAAALLETLLNAIDANDPVTGAHVRRVARFALILGESADLGTRELRAVERVALFHDVGKIHEALFDIIHDVDGLTPAQRRAIATHPRRGAEVLAPLAPFYPDLPKGVIAHHERWDGQGYPCGLAGEEIPMTARIVAIADTFDVVTHRRRYKPGQPASDAVTVIAEGRGTQFDPDLVDLFLCPPVFAAVEDILCREVEAPRIVKERRNREVAAHVPDVRFRWRSPESADPSATR